MTVIDLFAGIGGWELNLPENIPVVGIELEKHACATRGAAGLATIRGDVRQLLQKDMRGKIMGLLGSPPCQTFSAAGRRTGVSDVTKVVEVVMSSPRRQFEDWNYQRAFSDERTSLVLEPLRWATVLQPEFICLEQVRSVLPIWEAMALRLNTFGYSTWTGVLNAADYGVPQTRQRAFLIASRQTLVGRPPVTHTKTPVDATLFSSGDLEPWVTMAEALGWGANGRPSVTVTGGGTATGGAEPLAHAKRFRESCGDDWVLHTNRDQKPDGSRQTREVSEPAPTLTGKAGGQWQWKVNTRGNRRTQGGNEFDADEPSWAVTSKTRSWWRYRPATTVCGDPRLSWPGHHDVNARSLSPEHGAIKLTVPEALVLQSFPADYPVQGSMTAQFLQVGNAVPPVLAEHVLKQVLRD